ncbi:HDIG domain-containing protein [candidate division NPL-UPA2 bacterium]|nr:HDIG domain-containing protein [candidate division NPL-UPA2 bacterium]
MRKVLVEKKFFTEIIHRVKRKLTPKFNLLKRTRILNLKWCLALFFYFLSVWIVTPEAIRISPEKWISGIGGISILILILFFIVGIYLHNYHSQVLAQSRTLFLLGLVVMGVALLAKLIVGYELSGYLIPVAIAPMLVAMLVEARLGVVVTVILGIFVGVLTGYRLDYMVVALAGGMVGLFSVARVRRRTDLIKAGVLVSLANLVTILGFRLLGFSPQEPITNVCLWAVVNGAVSGVAVTGLLPIFEYLFKITTDIKLLELLDLNQPILEKLKSQAPGTYQSSLSVANLAESAAQAIGANPLLTKVGSYYHDIGKIKKASYFTENRMLASTIQKDKHKKLNPSMSSLILVSHVKEGVDLAYKNKLPEAIVDIVRQHHGTTLVSFFYQRAVDGDEHKIVKEDDFRYPGPKPQTKEAAIVMLADSVEAASRSLSNPPPSRIKNLVREVINDKLTDYQLDKSDLTLRDLQQISETFTRILISMFHTRVDYPKKESWSENKGEKSSKRSQSKPKNNQASSKRNVKRRESLSG